MTQPPSAKRRAQLFVGAVLSVSLLLVLLSAWDGSPPANAQAATTVGIDMNPATTTDTNGDGVYDSAPSTSVLEACRDGLVLNQEVTVDFFVLNVNNLISFDDAFFTYNGAVVKITKASPAPIPRTPAGTKFMSAQTASDVTNGSENLPSDDGVLNPADTNGLYRADAVDTGNESGDTGSGVLVRFTFKAVASG